MACEDLLRVISLIYFCLLLSVHSLSLTRSLRSSRRLCATRLLEQSTSGGEKPHLPRPPSFSRGGTSHRSRKSAELVKTKRSKQFKLTSSQLHIEEQITRALQSLRNFSSSRTNRNIKSQQIDGECESPSSSSSSSSSLELFLFPTTRECNNAMAAFGDAGEFVRALRLFGKMRQATTLYHKQQQLLADAAAPFSSSHQQQRHGQPQQYAGLPPSVPAPTLVTYSTLMSRANSLSKPRVALRLWKLMLESDPHLVPDTRSANILLNSYAKLADLDSALRVLEQMKATPGSSRGGGAPFSRTLLLGAAAEAAAPNLVTYNTVLDACLKAGDLDAALQTKADLDSSGCKPDARTYTNLIATVARKTSAAAGLHDPTLAFSLLQEMTERGVEPNGMTYSALIDAAGRCQRIDLALQGLRMMLRQNKSNRLENTVGAWTAAIDACGKTGRLETALRLFYAMPNFQVQPNAVTCGCLTDSLLRAGRTAETRGILRYMKAYGIVPSEVMYTSLMTRLERLTCIENKKQFHPKQSIVKGEGEGETKAIEVYTELITSLMESDPKRHAFTHSTKANVSSSSDSNTLLLKVFLVFQEMKTVGAQPDLACFNALLRACARAGDLPRAQDVLKQISVSGLYPNDTSWRQLIRAASNIRRSDLAMDIWKQGLSYKGGRRVKVDEPIVQWKPSGESFGALIIAYLREADATKKVDSKVSLYACVVDLFDGLLLGRENLGLNRIHPNLVLDSQRIMLLVLQAIVTLHGLCQDSDKQQSLVRLSCTILQLECFQHINPDRLHWASASAHRTAVSWNIDS